ncbi:fibronectin, partial [bacterium]|nr:fibronectin [bacterium]
MKKKKLSVILQMSSMLIILMTICKAEIDENEKRYFRVGSLQSQISAYGSERAWNNTWYEGLRWPADYLKQDNSVIKRAWITCKDFTDSKGRYFDSWAMSIVSAWAREALWPVSLKQIARFEAPSVFVDGNNVTAAFASDVDEIDATQIADRVIINVVNTAAG